MIDALHQRGGRYGPGQDTEWGRCIALPTGRVLRKWAEEGEAFKAEAAPGPRSGRPKRKRKGGPAAGWGDIPPPTA
jgi:hypothetical protein